MTITFQLQGIVLLKLKYTKVLLEWFDQNHLVAANPGKFLSMFLSTDKTDQMVNEQFSIGDKP